MQQPQKTNKSLGDELQELILDLSYEVKGKKLKIEDEEYVKECEQIFKKLKEMILHTKIPYWFSEEDKDDFLIELDILLWESLIGKKTGGKRVKSLIERYDPGKALFKTFYDGKKGVRRNHEINLRRKSSKEYTHSKKCVPYEEKVHKNNFYGIADKPKIDSLLEHILEDVDGIFEATHMEDNPDINFRYLTKLYTEGFNWNEIEKKLNKNKNVVNNFYATWAKERFIDYFYLFSKGEVVSWKIIKRQYYINLRNEKFKNIEIYGVAFKDVITAKEKIPWLEIHNFLKFKRVRNSNKASKVFSKYWEIIAKDIYRICIR